MKQSIEELVAGVLHEMEIYGLTHSTIRQYKRGFYRPAIKYFNLYNSGNYSLEILQSCMKIMKLRIQQEKYKSIIINQ